MSRFHALPVVITSVALLCSSAPSAQAPAAPPAGIFITQPDGTAKPLPGEMSPDVKQQGIGKAILSQGFIKPTMTVRYPGATANFALTELHPTFFFRLMDPNATQTDPFAYMSAMQGGGGMPPMGKDPKQFVLARMIVDGDARVLNSKGLEMFKLEIAKKATREFDVRPVKPLTPGEYAFFDNNGGPPTQIWAFSLRGTAEK